MRSHRRHVLAAATLQFFSGCVFEADGDSASVELINYDPEAHYLDCKFRGTENEETVQEFTVCLQPEEEERSCEPLNLERYEGSELLVRTRIDHGEQREHTVNTGLSHFDVSI